MCLVAGRAGLEELPVGVTYQGRMFSPGQQGRASIRRGVSQRLSQKKVEPCSIRVGRALPKVSGGGMGELEPPQCVLRQGPSIHKVCKSQCFSYRHGSDAAQSRLLEYLPQFLPQ